LFIPAGESRGIKGIDRTYRFICGPLKKRTYCCIVNSNGRRSRFLFQPSDELIKKINTTIKTKEPI
jgi:hypothetical protein